MGNYNKWRHYSQLNQNQYSVGETLPCSGNEERVHVGLHRPALFKLFYFSSRLPSTHAPSINTFFLVVTLPENSSVQSRGLLGCRRARRTDSAEMLFQFFKREAIVSSYGAALFKKQVSSNKVPCSREQASCSLNRCKC